MGMFFYIQSSNKRIYRNYFLKKDIPIYSNLYFKDTVISFSRPWPQSRVFEIATSTLQVVDLGFDIAVVLCGVNDGKKFFVGFREKRDDVMFFLGEAVEIPENNKRFTKITPKETQG